MYTYLHQFTYDGLLCLNHSRTQKLKVTVPHYENCLIISAAFLLSKIVNGIQTLPGTWQGNLDFDSNPYQV